MTIKEIPAKGKTKQKKTEHSKTMKENSTNNWQDFDTKTYQQPDVRETEQFWTKIWRQKNVRKRKYTSIYSKQHKKISNWKTPGTIYQPLSSSRIWHKVNF